MINSIETLELNAKIIRATTIKMAYDSRESHLSSALSCVDILNILFGGWMKHRKGNPERDRFILSKGHGCSAMYAAMAVYGIIPVGMLKRYSTTDSELPNHPCKFALSDLEISSGSLGHGLGIASGMMYGLRLDSKDNPRAIVLMSDGECNEGSVWEAAMFASAKKLNKLVAIVDNNGSQAVGRSDELMGFTSLEEKFKSFGWEAITVNGNSSVELLQALAAIPYSKDKPSAIIAKTVSGAGVSFMENNQIWFYRQPSKDDLNAALAELKVEPLQK
ncbi:MAG: transketolase [Victivallaceae bacterium]|jgi:transketolase